MADAGRARHTGRSSGQVARSAPADPARSLAYDVLRAVSSQAAYANLTLPALLRRHRLGERDAAFATELAYGTVRAQGALDAVIAACATRPPHALDPPVLDLLRLGTYQLLRTRVPPHAAVSASVDLARATGNVRASGLVNAVLRKVAARSWDEWAHVLNPGDPLAELATRYAHPQWIARAFVAALGNDAHELEAALAADDTRPETHLVARPGRITQAELLVQAGPHARAGLHSPFSVRLLGGDPAALVAVRDGRAGVQDEGSQLCALALAQVPVEGSDENWLDLCAGPGGKAALLAALGAERGARLHANELHRHRAELVRQATGYWKVAVSVGDAGEVTAPGPGYDRVLVDAPCTGLGALRRRPEARWRRRPDEVEALVRLQERLLGTAVELARPGGVVAYVTCSPLLAETTKVVAAVVAAQPVEAIDATAMFAGLPQLGPGPTVQLWPHRHGTDAMFCALLRKA